MRSEPQQTLPLLHAHSAPKVILVHGDCLQVMPQMMQQSVDFVFADLPYSVTRCAWDSDIDQDAFQEALQPLLSSTACILATANIRLAATLIAKTRLPFRYDLVWHKSRSSGFLNAKRAPLRAHELILYFAAQNAVYNVIKQKTWRTRPVSTFSRVKNTDCYGKAEKLSSYSYGPDRYPTSVIEPESPAKERGLHPTQKPIDLLLFLLKAYSSEGQTILDPTMGSGGCGVACVQLGRSFIGIEKDAHYYSIARQRIANAQSAAGFEVTV